MSVNKVGRAIFDFTLKCTAGMVQSDLQCGTDKLSDFKANLLLSNSDGLLADGSAQLAVLKDNVAECLKYTDSSTGATGGNPGQALSVFQADTKGYLDPTDSTSADLSDGGAEVQIRGASLGAQGSMKSGASAPAQFQDAKNADGSANSGYTAPVAGAKVTDGGIQWIIEERRKYDDGGTIAYTDADHLNKESLLATSQQITINNGHGKVNATKTRILGDKTLNFDKDNKTLSFEWKASDDFNIAEKAGDSAEDGVFVGTESSNVFTFNNGYIQNDEWSGEVTVKLTYTADSGSDDTKDTYKIELASTDSPASFKAEYTLTGDNPKKDTPTDFTAEFASSTHDIKVTSNFELADKATDPTWKISEAKATSATDTSTASAAGKLTVEYDAKLYLKDHPTYKTPHSS